MKTKKKRKQINWTYHIIELAVVFVGVTAGFVLNNWREDKAELQLEKKYLESFYNDVLLDEIDLDTMILHTQTKADALINILKKSAVIDKPLSEELAKKVVMEIMYLEWFTPDDDTYEDIINSGNLNLITDYKLKEKISSYYAFLNEVAKVEKYSADHMDNYGFPILYKNLNIYTLEFISKESYQSLEFTNMYLGVISFSQQSNKVYREALEKNKELKEELARVLEIE